MSNKYLLVLPAYNQGDTTREIVLEAQQFHVDILVIDDGSTDNTKEVLTTLKDIHKIYHKQNLGYGQTLIDSFHFGIENGFDYLITMDSDGQHLPAEIPFFLEEAHNWDIVSGSRYLNSLNGKDNAPPDRYEINKEITSTLNRITNLKITDSFCGFKAYNVDSLKKLKLNEPGYGMPLEVWLQAWKLGLKIKEIPVKLIYKDFDKQFGDGLHNPIVRLNYYNSIIEKELNGTGKQL